MDFFFLPNIPGNEYRNHHIIPWNHQKTKWLKREEKMNSETILVIW